MNEEQALKLLSRTAEMMAMCLRHEPGRADQLAEELHEAYREWFAAWQNRVQDR